MNAVEQKILLDQIIAEYKNSYVSKYRTLESVERDLEVLFARKVDGKTLEEIAKEFGVQRERIRQIEASTIRRIPYVLKRLKLKGMF